MRGVIPQDLKRKRTPGGAGRIRTNALLIASAQLGITHRRTAYHHPEDNSYIERFHPSLKEEEAWCGSPKLWPTVKSMT